MKFIKKNKTHLIIINAAWTVLIAISLFYNIYIVNKHNTQLVKNVAAAFFREIQTTRAWNASHGGVYVPITATTQPNQYLSVKNRDLTTTTGLKLTKINPAFMTRQISEINASKPDNIQFRMTSLNPIRPKNKPVPWESKALNSFEEGKKSYFQFDNEKQAYHYMGPLWVKEACLKCHAQQGYKLGEIRGGISVIVPKGLNMGNDDLSITSLIIMHISVWFIGIIMSILFWKYRERQLKKLSDEQNITKEQNIVLEATTKKAEAASIAKSQFLANMSHEIRTPINGILGSLELLTHTKDIDEQKKLIHISRNSGETLMTLIQDILDISKIEAGKFIINFIDFNLYTVVDELIPKHTMKAAKKNIEFIFRIPPDIPLHLTGDPDRLKQIIDNLCSNAIKFTEKGVICLIVERILEKDKMINLKFIVRDTGIGISNDNQEKLFNTFTQADSSITRNYGGTGLGLAISKNLTELMGGSINVKSELGHGAEFWIELPLFKQVIVDEETDKEIDKMQHINTQPNHEKYRILIVDDIETNRIILEENLKIWGFQFETASSGKEALELLIKAKNKNMPFHIGLIDYMMPEMDGIELAHLIKNDKTIKDIKLIMLSSADIQNPEKQFKLMDFHGYFAKPIRSKILLKALLNITSNLKVPVLEKNNDHLPEKKKNDHLSDSLPALHARILLAEDDPINQIIATKMFKKLQCTIDIVNNGKEAVSKLQKAHNYDIVFMDCQMPIMDGYEAAKKIREFEKENSDQLDEISQSTTNNQQPTLNRIPIVAMTANALVGDREKCLDSGMNDFITKPVNLQILAETIKKWTKK